MVDTLTARERSERMRLIRSRDTGPEKRLRSALHVEGFRFRLHVRALPGSPDIVFSTRRKVVFVNGCFWHGHACRRGARLPKTRRDYWSNKLDGNRRRDERNRRKLRKLGWSVMTVWECQLNDMTKVMARTRRFLDPNAEEARGR